MRSHTRRFAGHGRARWWTAASVLLAVAAACAGGCGKSPPRVEKIVILGVDGMDWNIIDPLLAEGRLPNIAGLIERGCRADLRSLEPVMKSPIIWTTIATGKGPRKHGISDFLGQGDERPLFNSNGWRARAFWDILSEKGYTVGVVNWMVSWPAKPVNGYNVSDRIVYRPEDGFSPVEHVTYPEELHDELGPHARPITDVADQEIAPFFKTDVLRDDVPPPVRESMAILRDVYGNDETVMGVTRYLLESREQPDVFAVYLNGVDTSSHFFWGPMDPSSIDVRLPDEVIEACSDVIPRYYERMDALLGEIIALVDENSTIILCSDHGFRGPHRSPDGLKLGIWMHRPVGVVVAAGPGIRAGATGADASVFDITPTLLALLGEPVARDMDGFVLDDIISRELLEESPTRYVDTYETGDATGGDEPVESPVDDEIMERLRSLGYIE
ncbi:MAG: alkaline phosphatase family protein [Candidatus Eisenbacteria bacterium]